MFLVGSYHKTGTVLIKNVFRKLNLLLNNRVAYMFKDHFNYFSDNEVKKWKSVVIIRNPYEIICSGMRYHQVSDETWLHQRKAQFGGATYSQCINGLSSVDDKLMFEMNNCGGDTVRDIYNDLKNRNFNEGIYVIRLEDLYDIRNLPRICNEIVTHLGIGDWVAEYLVKAFLATLRISHHRTHGTNELTYEKLFKEKHYTEFKRLMPENVLDVMGYELPKSDAQTSEPTAHS